MLQAFVGIVSREGLEAIYPEHPHSLLFLRRRTERAAGSLACFWSVIPDVAVGRIQSALRAGESAEALGYLQQQAREYGLIYPLDRDEADLPVIRY